MTRTERRQRIQRGNGQTAGEREPGKIREGGERGKGRRDRDGGGPEPPSDGKDSTLNIKVQSLGISQADVRGIGKNHPIMDKLGGPGGQTY